jgi:hypothetical protein
MPALGALKTLESLCLVETKVTDAGLAQLAGLQELVYLRLEGKLDGPAFSDGGLRQLGRLPRLERLTLYGEGFTDVAVPILPAWPRLRELILLDTRISNAATAPFSANRQVPFRCYQNDFLRDFDFPAGG